MTIPINPVDIRTTGVVPDDSTARLLQALFGGIDVAQRGQELAQRKGQLQLEQKRLAAALAEHEAARAQNAQIGEAVRGLLLSQEQPTLPPGAMPPGAARPMPGPPGPPTPFAQALQGLPAEAVVPFATATAGPRAQARADAATLATRRILATSDLTTGAGQQRAIRQVLQTVGPDQADKLAKTLNVGQGRFGHVLGPDNNLYAFDSQTGTTTKDRAFGAKPDKETQVTVQRNAALLVDLIDEQSQLVHDLGPDASKNPAPAALLQASKVLGLSTESVANMFRTDAQQLTNMLRTRFSHLYVGLLPHSRSSEALLQNLAESYWAPPGSGTALLQRAESERTKLRGLLQRIARGATNDLSGLPGFSQAAGAAAAEAGTVAPGATIQGSTSMDDWVDGVPPQ